MKIYITEEKTLFYNSDFFQIFKTWKSIYFEFLKVKMSRFVVKIGPNLTLDKFHENDLYLLIQHSFYQIEFHWK